MEMRSMYFLCAELVRIFYLMSLDESSEDGLTTITKSENWITSINDIFQRILIASITHLPSQSALDHNDRSQEHARATVLNKFCGTHVTTNVVAWTHDCCIQRRDIDGCTLSSSIFGAYITKCAVAWMSDCSKNARAITIALAKHMPC